MGIFDDLDLIIADFFEEADKFIQKQKEKEQEKEDGKTDD